MLIRRFLHLFVGALVPVALTQAQDWPQFRGPTADGQSKVSQVPLNWAINKNIAWKKEIPGRGWSSPVLSGGKIYMTTAVVTKGEEGDAQADRSLRVLRLDAKSGEIDWNVEVFAQDGASSPTGIHKKNGHASPTPIVAGGKVFVHFGHQGTAALDVEGKVLWKNRELSYPPRHGNGGSPVLHEGKLIFSCDAETNPFIVALDSETGAIKWRVARPATAQTQKFSFATCTAHQINSQWQIISPCAGAVDGINPNDGSQIWRVEYEGYSVVPGAVMGGGLLYLTSAYDTPDVYCVDPAKAAGISTDKAVVWTSGENAPKTVSLTVVGNEVYWVADSRGVVTCADRLTGKVHWSERTPLRDCSASPVHVAGRLYVTDEKGQTLVIKPGKTYEQLALNTVDEKTLASLAVSEGVLFQRSEQHLWRIEGQ